MTAVLVGLGMIVGLLGVILPMLPGLALIWFCGLIYGLLSGFNQVGITVMVIMTVLAIAGTVAQYVLPGKAASGAGATRTSILLGVLLGIIGFFVIPVVGLPVGGIGGIFLGEYLRTSDLEGSRQATWATVKGFGVGVLAQLACGIAMILAWLVWVLA